MVRVCILEELFGVKVFCEGRFVFSWGCWRVGESNGRDVSFGFGRERRYWFRLGLGVWFSFVEVVGLGRGIFFGYVFFLVYRVRIFRDF